MQHMHCLNVFNVNLIQINLLVFGVACEQCSEGDGVSNWIPLDLWK